MGNDSHINRMVEAIDAFIKERLGITNNINRVFFRGDFETIMDLLDKGSLVEAIKVLRLASETTLPIDFNPNHENNTFLNFIKKENYNFFRTSRLGLKEAKDVIDILNETKLLWKK